MIVEKIDRGITTASKVGIGMVIGWMACAVWHQTGATDKAAAVAPVAEAAAGCEHWRAGVASKLALEANTIAPSQIPADHCPRVPPLSETARK